jgi:spore coat polysaccharide biosynthesis predicted glycosyltransferase SpsG/CMP-N-acetylneuraminic acid synthetase
MKSDFCVIIPAVKKNVAFADDLVKKLDGISLIKRVIDKASQLTNAKHIYVVTDTDEINSICIRSGINGVYKANLNLKSQTFYRDILFFIGRIRKKYNNIIVTSPYSPLVKAEILRDAYQQFLLEGPDLMLPVELREQNLFNITMGNIHEFNTANVRTKFSIQLGVFQILSTKLLFIDKEKSFTISPFTLNHEFTEITNYQDWWICEKLLRRRRIVFNIIGSQQDGMGHIYRALTLAHEISDHEVMFICEEGNSEVATKFASKDYWFEVYKPNQLFEFIISLKPDMVINDILDTDAGHIKALKRQQIKVVNFEDFGLGALEADLTINELFDEEEIEGGNILWGMDYFCLREEFIDAKPRLFNQQVKKLLITFGGTDAQDLTLTILNAVVDFCQEKNIRIYIVAGAGYLHKDKLIAEIDRFSYHNIEFTHATGVMSTIMEQVDIAISSNGRTTYELAHMNVPTIIISQHSRESTHKFTSIDNGFLNLDVFKGDETSQKVLSYLKVIVHDSNLRKLLHKKMEQFDFSQNKKRILQKILEILE